MHAFVLGLIDGGDATDGQVRAGGQVSLSWFAQRPRKSSIRRLREENGAMRSQEAGVSAYNGDPEFAVL